MGLVIFKISVVYTCLPRLVLEDVEYVKRVSCQAIEMLNMIMTFRTIINITVFLLISSVMLSVSGDFVHFSACFVLPL